MTAPKVYLETSVVSYLTADGSRDLVLAAHQEVTRAWWASRENFAVYASQFVLDEASAGDAVAAAKTAGTEGRSSRSAERQALNHLSYARRSNSLRSEP